MQENVNTKNIKIKNKQKDIIVSIVLSESTASLLQVDAAHLEDGSSDSSICTSRTDNAVTSQAGNKRNGENCCSYWCKISNGKKLNNIDEVYSDIAFFSTTITESDNSCEKFDDLSDESLHDVLSTSLEPVKVYTKPLTAIRSMAHKNKIKTEASNIYISVLDSELTVTDSGWINVCRICHGGESGGDLLSPCRCRGSIALAHIACLERWLKESENSHCELCQHHYQILKEPKYSIPMSILLFLRHPGDHFRELLLDFIALLIYTPSAIASTYMLMLLCEAIAKSYLQQNRNLSGHVMAFAAIFGMATIDFTYSSWLMVTLHKHMAAWKEWYKNNCNLKLILPKRKRHRQRRKRNGSI